MKYIKKFEGFFKKKVEDKVSFKIGDLVKRKSDGKIGIVKIVGRSKNSIFLSKFKLDEYIVDFSGDKEGLSFVKYSPDDLEIPSEEEIEIHKNSKKYNI